MRERKIKTKEDIGNLGIRADLTRKKLPRAQANGLPQKTKIYPPAPRVINDTSLNMGNLTRNLPPAISLTLRSYDTCLVFG